MTLKTLPNESMPREKLLQRSRKRYRMRSYLQFSYVQARKA